jgi:acyl-CoA thioesterase
MKKNLAKKIVNEMLKKDKFSQWLGIKTNLVEKGHCILSMKVRPEMLNGFEIAHGGICFSLADSALAFASNSYGRVSVALDCSISFPVAVNVGDKLTCEAKELSLTNKIGTYLIEITNQKKQKVAFFKGTVYRTNKEWFPLHTNYKSTTNITDKKEMMPLHTNYESVMNVTNKKTKPDLIYPELSYKIIGCAYKVFNEIGGGHKEITYHKSFGIALKKDSVSYKENIYFPVKFKNETVEKGYFDYLVEERIIVELKSRDRLVKKDFEQLANYLKNSNLKLGILIAFGRTEVKFKRIINIELLNEEKKDT